MSWTCYYALRLTCLARNNSGFALTCSNELPKLLCVARGSISVVDEGTIETWGTVADLGDSTTSKLPLQVLAVQSVKPNKGASSRGLDMCFSKSCKALVTFTTSYNIASKTSLIHNPSPAMLFSAESDAGIDLSLG